MSNPFLKQLIMEIVENQLQENDPPETSKTLKRLMAAGYSRQQAMEMIGAVAVEEIWEVMKNNRDFDEERYVARLAELK